MVNVKRSDGIQSPSLLMAAVFGVVVCTVAHASIFFNDNPKQQEQELAAQSKQSAMAQEPATAASSEQRVPELLPQLYNSPYATEWLQQWATQNEQIANNNEESLSNQQPIEEDEQMQVSSNQDETNEFNVPTRIGGVAGVAVNAKNELVIFHRAGRVWDEFSFNEKTNVFNKTLGALGNATLTTVDTETGQILNEHGSHGQFYMPHGISIDSEGNYWLTDVARHQVIKLSAEFKVLLELGEKMIPGNDEAHFCKPTDVAVAKSGDIFVADGYCNSRIIKFNRDGKFLGSFGVANSNDEQPKNGEFRVPHSLTLIEDLDLLCVADRDNQRIQCFTAGLTPPNAHRRAAIPMGTFVTKAQNIGRIMAIREKQHYLIGITNMNPSKSDKHSLFIMDMNSGHANTFARGISDAHSLAISETGDVYVGQIGPAEVLKFSWPPTSTDDDNNNDGGGEFNADAGVEPQEQFAEMIEQQQQQQQQ